MYMSGFGTGGSWGMESVKKIDISSEAEWDRVRSFVAETEWYHADVRKTATLKTNLDHVK